MVRHRVPGVFGNRTAHFFRVYSGHSFRRILSLVCEPSDDEAQGRVEASHGSFTPRKTILKRHVSHMVQDRPGGEKYRYFAGELSIACPRGLSGGPVFRPEMPDEVLGVVTEDLDVGTIEHSVETEEDDGQRYSLETKRIISYGLAVVLIEVNDWLTQNIPTAGQ
jgi:hypothetical protein